MSILIINSSRRKNKPLVRMLKPLCERLELSVFSSDNLFSSSFVGGKSLFLGPSAGGWGDMAFIPFLVLSWPAYFLWLFWRRVKYKDAVLVCIETNERAIFTLSARLLGMKVVWLELPERRRSRWSPSTWISAALSSLSSVAGTTSHSLNKMVSAGFNKRSMVFVPPAGEWDYARQDDLFSELAVSDKPKFFFKSFTIGTVVDFSDRGHFEALLKAIKNCSNIIPNIRLVVIGSGSERRGLNWLSKKLGIENKVWFVGEQDDLIKWFDSFDIFFSLTDDPNLFDLEMVLLAMSRGIPAAVFKHPSFEDFVVDGDTGLVVPSGTADDLAKKLIEVEPNKELLKNVGINGKSLVEVRLSRKNQSQILIRLLE